MNKLYGYIFADSECAGCVLASTKIQAVKKIKAYYKNKYPDMDANEIQSPVWLYEYPADVIEIY